MPHWFIPNMLIWGLGFEGVLEYIYSYAYMGQIWAICLYGLKLQRLDIIYAVFFTRGYAGMGSIHPHPYPHTRWVQEFIQ